MKLKHRLAALVALLPLLALGAWRLRPPTVVDIPPCRNPVGVRLEERNLAACLGAANSATVDQVLARLGMQHTCPPRRERVEAGQMLFFSRDDPCHVSIEPLPARLALTLGLKVDLNRADAEELQALPRIGPKKARWIVRDRLRRGPYKSLEELRRVKGIGPRTVETLRPLVQVGATSK